MGVFDIKSNGLVIANNGETKLINKHCFNNKKARFVNVEIPPTKLTYRISQINSPSLKYRGIFIQARPIESTDDNDFVGLLGVITEFWNLTRPDPNQYLYYYADTEKRKYLSEYGVVDKDTENETFYTNGEVIQTVDISSFPESPSDAVLYRMIEDGEKHYYRYYSNYNLFIRVYFSTDIIDLTYKVSNWSHYDEIYEHVFKILRHNTETHTSFAQRADYIPSVLVSNNIANKIVLPNSNYTVSPIKMTDRYSHISTETNLFTIIANRGLSSDNKYYVDATYAYYRDLNNSLYLTMPCKIYRDTTSGAQDYGGKIMLYYQEMHDYFAEIFPEITDDMTLSQIDEYINTEHTSPYSFIWFEPFTKRPISKYNIKEDTTRLNDIFPMIIKEVPNDELSELYFCQSEESATKEGYPTTYIGQPMLNKRMAFNVPYSVAFLNSKVPGHFPYTTYNIWSGKRYINIALPQTEYNISQDTEPIISARRLANSTTESYTEIIAKVYPGSYAVDPTTKTVKTSGTIRTVRLYNLTVYETYIDVTLTPFYQNDVILYWYYRMYGEYDPEQMGDEGSIELRLYNNIDGLDNKNTLCMVCNFDIYTYFDLIGLELFKFNIKPELVDAEGDGVVTTTGSVSNRIYDVTAEEDEQEISYHYSYSSSSKKLHIDWNNNVINYPISTYGSLTVNENYIGPYLIIRSKYIAFNFTEDETLNNIINPNPNVIDYDGPHTLTVNARPRSFERITDYFAGNISFLYSREAYRVLTRTITFSRTMDFDTSKPLCLTFKQFNIYHIDGSKTLSYDLHYQLQYNDVYRGWYIRFEDEPIDPDDEEWTPGFITMVIKNTGITITLDDYNSEGVYYTAWSIEITGGLSLYQEED